MFGNLGWEEVLLLAVIGLVVFGPDRLPKAAADAARLLRQLRSMARGEHVAVSLFGGPSGDRQTVA